MRPGRARPRTVDLRPYRGGSRQKCGQRFCSAAGGAARLGCDLRAHHIEVGTIAARLAVGSSRASPDSAREAEALDVTRSDRARARVYLRRFVWSVKAGRGRKADLTWPRRNPIFIACLPAWYAVHLTEGEK